MTLNVFFDLKTNPDTDQILTQLRVGQAESQLPTEARALGVTVKKSFGMPLLIFVLQDHADGDLPSLQKNVATFLAAVRQRPEIASGTTTFTPTVPQVFVNVDRDKTIRQGVPLASVYQTLQAFMGGAFVNYFNRFGRTWQVYVQADGDYRTSAEDLGQFHVKNDQGAMVPLSALTSIEARSGPEFTLRYNLYRSAQFNLTAKPGYSSRRRCERSRKSLPKQCPPAWASTTWA